MQTRESNRTFQQELQRVLPGASTLIAWGMLAVVFVLFYWASLQRLLTTWCTEDDYQHGFIVPIFAVYLLWHRREMIVPFAGRGSWWGLPFFAVWALARWVAVYFNFDSLPELSIVPFFLAVALFVGGWQGLRWSWPAILFLCFMIPLPAFVHGWLSQQLQGIAAYISGFVIQTLGIPAMVMGHAIQLSNSPHPLNVAEACSGLRMMTLFFAMCIGAAFLVQKPLWERLLMIVSAAPIAIVSNVVRIVMTAVLCEIARQWPDLISLEKATETIHNWVGYVVMMPCGLLLLWGEMYLLSKLLLAPLAEQPLTVGRLAKEPAAKAPGVRPVRSKPRR